jgi:hypothetical protein
MLSAIEVALRLGALRCVAAYGTGSPPVEKLSELRQSTGEEAFGRRAAAFHDKTWGRIMGTRIWDALSPRELILAHTTLTSLTTRQQIDASWRWESVVVLGWTLNLVPQLPPWDRMATRTEIKVPPSPDIDVVAETLRLRDGEEIGSARRIAEAWHWRSRTFYLAREYPDQDWDTPVRVTARSLADDKLLPPLIEEDFPARGKAYRDLDDAQARELASVAMERHTALNWICGRAPGNRWDETPTDT